MRKHQMTTICLKRKTVTHLLVYYLPVIVLRLKPDIEAMKSFIDVYGGMQCNKRIRKAIEHIRQAFNNGLKPKLTDEGTSGTYEMRGIEKQKVAVFKPIDEEPFAPNNPRGN